MTGDINDSGQPIGWPLDVVLPRPLPATSAMLGRFCSVVPIDPQQHAQGLFDAFAADRTGRDWTYLPYGPFARLAEFRAWIDKACCGADPLFHTIIAGGQALGLASLLRIDAANGVIEVGHIHYAPALQQTPAATEAMYLLMRRVFDELGYRRYEWKCDQLNEPSCIAARRLGFTFEGVFRQATQYKGRNRDTAWFSVIDKEWPSIRASFEDWLAPSNFDSAGCQRAPLRR